MCLIAHFVVINWKVNMTYLLSLIITIIIIAQIGLFTYLILLFKCLDIIARHLEEISKCLIERLIK